MNLSIVSALIIGGVLLLIVFSGPLLSAVLAMSAWLRRRRRTIVDLAEMPQHPERVRGLGDPSQDKAFEGLAEQLLDDGLADVCENLRIARAFLKGAE